MASPVRSLVCLSIVAVASLSILRAQAPPTDADELVKKIQEELAGPPPPESKPNPMVPHGEFIGSTITDSKIYPGTQNNFQVYVPAQYNPTQPACLLLKLDGMSAYEATVLDNLIAKKDIPVIIGIGVVPGFIKKRQSVRFNRSYEFDSTNDHFPDFVLNELLPAAQKLTTHDGRAIHLSPDGKDHAVMGASTGGIGSFTLAWRRPDQFSRVYSEIGTFVSMRGGHEYPALIRKTDPKPIRIFLEDGSTDAWNPLFGSWYEANLNMESALRFAGYEVAHAWGDHGHDSRPGQTILPDVLRWLWRGYPATPPTGISQNSTLREITIPEESWTKIAAPFQSIAGLTANSKGDVYLSDSTAATVYRIGQDGHAVVFAKQAGVTAQAFGPDDTLYGLVPEKKHIIQLDTRGVSHTIAEGIPGHSILIAHEGTLYVSEPGAHSDLPSRIWQIKPGSAKKLVDEGLSSASGITFSPDGSLFFAAEKSSKWIYSYVVKPDGSFEDKQAFYWLHMTDIPNNSGAEDLAVDTNGNLYVATRMGIQICDQNGRVRAILPLPTPSGPSLSLCFGGEHFDFLYATDGKQIFRRHLKAKGIAPWSARIAFSSQGPG